jgi:hypothetical protein
VRLLAAEHVGKGADECRAHYLATYIEHEQFPLPKRDASMAHVSSRRPPPPSLLPQAAAVAARLCCCMHTVLEIS